MISTNTHCLGIITARGGSKGVPEKNIRLLAGKPLINYAIEVGISCSYIDVLMVTTDSPDIAKVSERAGAEVPFLRPPELATDSAKQEDAIFHAMDWYEGKGQTFELVCLLQPTLPFRRLETLNLGFELLRENPHATGVMSVAPAQSSPTNMNTLRVDGSLCDFVDPCFKFANRQERPKYFELSAVVTIAKWDTLRNTGSFCHDTALSMVVDPIEASDIDEPLDFVIADYLLKLGISDAQGLTSFFERMSVSRR